MKIPFVLGGGSGDVSAAGNNAFSGVNAFTGANRTPASPMAALVIDTSKALNTKTVTVDSTFTFSGAPAADTWFSLFLTNGDVSPHVITIPTSFNVNGQANTTSFTILAGGKEYITWRYDGTNYQVFGVPVPGFSSEVSVASAATTDIGAAASINVGITGTTGITSLGTAPNGTYRQGRFTGILTLTHNATSLILPGGANITTAANDRFGAYSLGSGNWLVLWYVKASGTALVGSSSLSLATNSSGTLSSGTLLVPFRGRDLTRIWRPSGSGGVNTFGWSIGAVGTGSDVAATATAPMMRRLTHAAATIDTDVSTLDNIDYQYFGNYPVAVMVGALSSWASGLQRWYWGFFQTTPTGDGVMSTYSAVGLRASTSAGDTAFKIVSDNGTTRTVVDTGVTIDANVHTFELVPDKLTGYWLFFIDGNYVGRADTTLPNTAQVCRYTNILRTLSNATRTLDIAEQAVTVRR